MENFFIRGNLPIRESDQQQKARKFSSKSEPQRPSKTDHHSSGILRDNNSVPQSKSLSPFKSLLDAGLGLSPGSPMGIASRMSNSMYKDPQYDRAGILATVRALEADLAETEKNNRDLRLEVSELYNLLEEAAEVVQEADDLRQRVVALEIEKSKVEKTQEHIYALELQHEIDQNLISEYVEALEQTLSCVPDEEFEDDNVDSENHNLNEPENIKIVTENTASTVDLEEVKLSNETRNIFEEAIWSARKEKNHTFDCTEVTSKVPENELRSALVWSFSRIGELLNDYAKPTGSASKSSIIKCTCQKENFSQTPRSSRNVGKNLQNQE